MHRSMKMNSKMSYFYYSVIVWKGVSGFGGAGGVMSDDFLLITTVERGERLSEED